MELIRTLATLTIITSSAIHAQETTIGIGAAVNDDLKLYLPINTGSILIEPTLLLFSRDTDTKDDAFKSSSDTDVIEIGVGIFNKTNIANNTYVYYGARFGYIETKFNNKNTSSESITFSSTKDKQDGYFLAPTIGAEYYITSNFSIGLDLSLNYSKTDGSEERTFSETTSKNNTDETAYKTEAEIIARYHF